MEYILNPVSHEHLLSLLEQDFISTFLIGESKLSLRLSYVYEDLDELFATIGLIKKMRKKVYLDMHTMLTNDLIPYTSVILQRAADINIDGIVFSDFGLYHLAKKLARKVPLIWSSETTATNWYSIDYWQQKGISAVALAKELTKKTITSINETLPSGNTNLTLQIFGPLNMFHSRRNLLNNYYCHLDKQNMTYDQGTYQYLYDKEREKYYPIFEDDSGTHIMSSHDVCFISELDFIFNQERIKYLQIDCKGHSTEFMQKVLKLFEEAIMLYKVSPQDYLNKKNEYFKAVQDLYETPYRTIDKGFLYKPTIY